MDRTSLERVARRRWRRRAVCVGVIVASFALGSCSEGERRLGRWTCYATEFLARGCAAGAIETARHGLPPGTPCGSCAPMDRCNTLYQPPRCTPLWAPAGTRCGRVGETSLDCAQDLSCRPSPDAPGVSVCTPPPREGEACEVDDSPWLRCAPDHVCLGDGRCHRVCAPCGPDAECNLLESPPRCTRHEQGARCGQWAAPTLGRENSHSFGCDPPLLCLDVNGVTRCTPPR